MSGIGQINNAGIFSSIIYKVSRSNEQYLRIIDNLFKKITGNLWYYVF